MHCPSTEDKFNKLLYMLKIENQTLKYYHNPYLLKINSIFYLFKINRLTLGEYVDKEYIKAFTVQVKL